MSYADKIFKETCNDILTKGTNTNGENVRAMWDDTNEPAYTKKLFGVVNRYDLRKEFPILTLRKVPLKSAVDEILWIYQKRSNNVAELSTDIWDAWADEHGTIGKAYGYQLDQPFIHHYNENHEAVALDQVNAVLYDLKHTPFSRRIMTNMYNNHDLFQMQLHPCAYSCTFNVTDDGGDKLVLNMLLNQRSQDMLVANGWNAAQYAMLLKMIAQVSNMEAGELVHVITDAHIYDRHVDMVKTLMEREEYDAPTITLDPDIKNFYQFTTDSFTISNYKYGESIGKIPVAI